MNQTVMCLASVRLRLPLDSENMVVCKSYSAKRPLTGFTIDDLLTELS
jgi:hypothetical protein